MDTFKKVLSMLFFVAMSFSLFGYSKPAFAIGERAPIVIAFDALSGFLNKYYTQKVVEQWKSDESKVVQTTNPANGGQLRSYLRNNIDLFNGFIESGSHHDRLISNLRQLQSQCTGLDGIDKVKKAEECHLLLTYMRDVAQDMKNKISSYANLLTTAKEHTEFSIFDLLVKHNDKFGMLWNDVGHVINLFDDTLLIK